MFSFCCNLVPHTPPRPNVKYCLIHQMDHNLLNYFRTKEHI